MPSPPPLMQSYKHACDSRKYPVKAFGGVSHFLLSIARCMHEKSFAHGAGRLGMDAVEQAEVQRFVEMERRMHLLLGFRGG